MGSGVVLVGPLDRVLYLRTLPALDRLSAGDLAAIAAIAREEFFPRGARVIGSADPPTAIHIVVDGVLSVTQQGLRKPDAGAGASVGLLPVLARWSRGVEATALSDTLTLRLDADDHLEVCRRHFSIVQQYVRYLSQRMMSGDGAAAPEMPAGGTSPVVPRTGRLNTVERLLVLLSCGVFPESAPDALSELSRHVEDVRFVRGTKVWNTGDVCDHFFVLFDGEVTRRHADPDRSSSIRGIRALGVHEALGGGDRKSVLVAETDVRMLQVGVAPLLDIMEDHFDLAVDFLALRASELLRFD